ncbi:hypothetical protein F8M41_001963 [Gigaspora margarita]|uniref:Uncharacterized protein n=1 Tax=Gigaspora margarita TaxID=4874 RepID=A0A8H4A8V2_GIGMA|nr:hypothetical protein F8M41_001963 [Gigaspora margarita]
MPKTHNKTIKDLQEENQRLALENSELKKTIEKLENARLALENLELKRTIKKLENALVKANLELFEFLSDIAKW